MVEPAAVRRAEVRIRAVLGVRTYGAARGRDALGVDDDEAYDVRETSAVQDGDRPPHADILCAGDPARSRNDVGSWGPG